MFFLAFPLKGKIFKSYLQFLFKHIFRSDHSLDGGLACYDWRCHLWNSDTGSWDLSHKLDIDTGYRNAHISWTPGPDSGTYLMGGSSNLKSVQLVNTDGTVDPVIENFLRYNTA